MAFKAISNASGTKLSGNGMLNVLNGKYRLTEKIVKKDTPAVKGIELVLSIASGKGIAFEKWVPESNRPVADDTVKSYPLTVNIFLPETDEIGKSFINLFANLKVAGLDEKISEGFSCPNFVLDEIPKYTATLASDEYWLKGDFKKLPIALEQICEDLEAVECALEFPVVKSGGGNFGGSKGESQADKTKARLAIIAEFSVSDSEVQKGFLTLSKDVEDLTLLQYFTLILG